MDNSTHWSEKLVRWLDNELSDDEIKVLKKELSRNPALQAEYDSLLQARAAVRYAGLHATVSGIHQEMMKEKNQPVISVSRRAKTIRYTLAIAASLLLLVGGYIAYNFLMLTPDKVFASAYQRYELVTLRDTGSALTPAEKAYQDGNYAEVIRIHNAGDKSLKGEFLCGAAALELRDNSKAITCFKEVLEMNEKNQVGLKDETEFYLALAYLRNREYERSLELMNRIRDDKQHVYNEKITPTLIRKVRGLKRK